MKFRENSKYSIVVPTSMGVRITPDDRQPVHSSNIFKMQATSAESNVISVSASLGERVKALTVFVKGSPIAKFIQNDLRSRNIEYEGKEIPQGGPWGYRHQINIADSGYGVRAPRVFNDRSGEIGKELDAKDFDLNKLFVEEGVKLVHISGLIASLSAKSSAFCLDIARVAKQNGTMISFDLNYRESFWVGRDKELKSVFNEIASISDILIGNEEDFQLSLGIKGPESGGDDLLDKIESFKIMIENVKKHFPKTKIIATTLREVLNANEHLWGSIMKDGNDWLIVKPRLIKVLDRIGGGDGFVGGLLYGLISGMNNVDAFHFGWANGALTTSLLDDYSQPLDEEEVWSVWEGNARVRR